MMEAPPPPPHSPPHQYPQAIQLKLYQAFIFSIPILFSIILFLLFYLFYLKRRAAAASSSAPHPHPLLPTTASDITTQHDFDSDMKNEVKNKLCEIKYDDCMKAWDSSCCVCLGEFELKEELLQVRGCNHMFHVDCIRHWLLNHSTCPLCRAPVAVFRRPPPPPTSHHHHLRQQQQHITSLTPPHHGSTSAAAYIE